LFGFRPATSALFGGILGDVVLQGPRKYLWQLSTTRSAYSQQVTLVKYVILVANSQVARFPMRFDKTNISIVYVIPICLDVVPFLLLATPGTFCKAFV